MTTSNKTVFANSATSPTPTASLATKPRVTLPPVPLDHPVELVWGQGKSRPITGDESCWMNWEQQVFRPPFDPAIQVGQFQPLHYDNKTTLPTMQPFKIPRLIAPEKSAYHTKVIPRGEFGEVSKIREELAEVEDAIEQNNPLLTLCELADLLGAIEGYSKKHHNMTLMELYKMTELTRRAFESGQRK